MKLIANMPIPNTLGVPAVAQQGCIIDSMEMLQAFSRSTSTPLRILGEGSNIIPMPEVSSLIGLMQIKGIDVLAEDSKFVSLRVAAGENWHQCVLRCLEQGWYGLENLALIPGSVGAAPVQNIGAYGVEIATFIEAVEFVDATGARHELRNDECEFSYRDSLFKRQVDWIIASVTLRLPKDPAPVTTYPDIHQELDERGISDPLPIDVAEAVIAVRKRKLPDPDHTPNAGSFFKNPIVSSSLAQTLKETMGDLVSYPQAGAVKLSAAQLIDRAGWKARQLGDVTVWSTQPLVVINPNGQDATDVLAFAEDIRRDIATRYGVELELEPSPVS